jgi:hypothetical protein
MIVRLAIAMAAALAAGSALAEPMNLEAARRFVVGNLFAFNCFDGSRGAGRIYGDGSVIGTVQLQGNGPVRQMWLPAGTLRVKGQAVCASLKGLPFEPCFNLDRLNAQSFRGTIAGMNFAYCDFTRQAPAVASLSLRRQAPLSLDAAAVVADE